LRHARHECAYYMERKFSKARVLVPTKCYASGLELLRFVPLWEWSGGGFDANGNLLQTPP
jgi:hypothetical protein